MSENRVESTGDVTLDNAVRQWLEFDKVSRVIFLYKLSLRTCTSLNASC